MGAWTKRDDGPVVYEGELGIVIGKPASHVPVSRARDFIFGYTIELDVSDRGSRGDSRYGSDWLAGKSHDTFAPMGPFITPKEFVADVGNLPVRFRLNGELMQESNTSLMIHDIGAIIEWISAVMTLLPGDLILTGTPGGTAIQAPGALESSTIRPPRIT